MKAFLRLLQIYVGGCWLTALTSSAYAAARLNRGWYDWVAAILVLAAASVVFVPAALVLGHYAKARQSKGGTVI